MIYHFTPMAGDKNYGEALNKHCALVPNDSDWIVIRDIDTAVITPHWIEQVEKIVAEQGEHFDIIGGVTNRLNVPEQVPFPELFDNLDILVHRAKGIELYEKYGTTVEPYTGSVLAGFLLIFPKRVWNQIKFPDGLLNFDRRFCKYARDKGFKLGIAKGLYIYHYYRGHIKDARKHWEHLLQVSTD